MCGIVGYTGGQQAKGILIDGLQHLEYRGYDSAGIAVFNGKEIEVVRRQGKVAELVAALGADDCLGTCGIGHTRWATHGAPSDVNSHPHCAARVSLVHNGIIENYMEIKEFLQEKGVVFHSDTDTEVVAQLLDYYYRGDILDAVQKVLHRIEGSYGLGIICSEHPEQLIAARKDSPLVLGYGDGFNMMASDVTALIKYTRDVSYMENGEIAVLTRQGIQVYNILLDPGVCKQRYYKMTLSDYITPDYPPTYHWYGKNDMTLMTMCWSAQGPVLEKALARNHVTHIYHVYDDAPHAVAAGKGTDAEGWLNEAVAFWEEQVG